MDIKEQIEQLQKQIDELKAKINQENKPVKRWRAKFGDDYWCIDTCLTSEKYWCIGTCSANEFGQKQGHSIDNERYQLGNYFKTEQEARDYLDNILTKQKLKDLALELNNGVEIDWEKGDQRKYFIIYDNCDKNFKTDFRYIDQNLGQIYCLDQNFLEIAKERIGEDRLIKLIKSGM